MVPIAEWVPGVGSGHLRDSGVEQTNAHDTDLFLGPDTLTAGLAEMRFSE